MKNTTLASPAGAPTTEQKTLRVVGAGTPFNDALMGKQLTEQYHLAVGGMTQVLRFGAMMMGLRQNLSTREQVSKGGRGNKDGVSDWLRQHAPEVNRTTAYRFLHVAEAVAKEFELPAKVSFIELATSSAADLPEKLQQKQTELWDFVGGTSQRSWLDRFVPAPKQPAPKLLGPGGALSKTPEEIETMRRAEVVAAFAQVDRIMDHHDWHFLTDDQIRTGIDIFSAWVKEAKAYVSIPRSERVAAKLKKLAK